MKIYIATDHAGFELKEQIKAYLLQEGYEVEDCGAYEYDKEDDYPDFVFPVAEKVAFRQAQGEHVMGIIIGRSGNGEAIVANKIKDIRAVVGWSEENVERSRTHNDANVLSLGSAFVSQDQAKKLIDIFLKTPFSNEERHIRRIKKIREIERG